MCGGGGGGGGEEEHEPGGTDLKKEFHNFVGKNPCHPNPVSFLKSELPAMLVITQMMCFPLFGSVE